MQKARDVRFFNQEQMRKLELPGNMADRQAQPLHPQHRRLLGAAGIRYPHLCARPVSDPRRHQPAYQGAKETQAKLGIDALLLPIDHLATRVYSQNREAAILEYLTLSSYYYWGSYDIADQNSSTNVTKSVHHANELESPAKVFTAANHPYFINHLLNRPRPPSLRAQFRPAPASRRSRGERWRNGRCGQYRPVVQSACATAGRISCSTSSARRKKASSRSSPAPRNIPR